MARRQASLLSVCQIHLRDKEGLRRRLMMSKNQMTLIAKMYWLKMA